MAAGDQQPPLAHAADIFLALEDEAGRAAVGLDRPLRGRRERRHRQQLQHRRRHLPMGELLAQQRPLVLGQIAQPVDPGDLMPVGADDGNALVRRRQRMRAHGADVLMGQALRVDQHQPAEGVAREGMDVAHVETLARSGLRGRVDVDVGATTTTLSCSSASTRRACASHKRQ
ncbi:hypothetical protein Ddc_19133 [Ditylenchus destructor]|nr:hypothetical protein Ddc_19133 [Ditylenchus destructor]